MKKLFLGTMALVLAAMTPLRAAESVRGDYVEVRTNQVYA